MRELPRIKKLDCEPSDWYFDFLNACRADAANRSIPEFIDPDFKAHLGICCSHELYVHENEKASWPRHVRPSCNLSHSLHSIERI